ncbi:hypothetical protein EIP86_000748 [Pleurotus ostreatoroseus]|nr:hypothetical protein EIP86_000748 [Pleurotus ostreatoroseus]
MSGNAATTQYSKTEQVAVAYLVDSSLAIMSEWTRLMQEYLNPLLQRLHESHPSRMFRIAIVCYAPASTRPKPLLSATVWIHPGTAIPKLVQHASDFGLGRTGGGGTRGMAVLEGMASVLELFDTLKESESNLSFTSHVVHVAASPPDTAERPIWNTLPHLDNVTWESLPAEFRKITGTSQAPWFPVRSHHTVKLMGFPPPQPPKVTTKRPAPETTSTPDSHKKPRVLPSANSPKVTSTPPHVATNTPKIAPATPTLPPPSAQPLSAPQQPPPQPPPVQPPPIQPQPPAPTQTPIQPRPTPTPLLPAAAVNPPPPPQQPITASAAVLPAAGNIQVVATAKPAPGAIVGPGQPGPSTNAGIAQRLQELTPQAVAKLKERFLGAEQSLIKKGMVLRTMREQGKLPEDHPEVKAFQNDMEKLKRLKAYVAQVQERVAGGMGGQGQSRGQGLGQGQFQGNAQAQMQPQAGPSNTPTNMMTGLSQFNTAGQMAAGAGLGQPQGQGQMQSLMQGQVQNNAAMQGLPQNMTPQFMAQMQKMLDQRNRTPHAQPGVPQAQPVPGPSQLQPQPQPQAPPQAQPGPLTAGQAATAGAQQTMWWRGYLRWSGTDPETGGKKDVFTHVFMRALNGSQDLNLVVSWPKEMTLSPSREPAVEIDILQGWMKQNPCVIFVVTPLPVATNGQQSSAQNAENHKALVRLLTGKNLYAIAAWPPGPDRPAENRLLLFTTNGSQGPQLLACYFMAPGGMPELPKSMICGLPVSQLPQELVAILRRLSLDQQKMLEQQPLETRMQTFRVLMIRIKQQKQAQAQAQAQGQMQMQGQAGMAQQQQQQPQMNLPAGLNMNPGGMARPGGQMSGLGGGQPQQAQQQAMNQMLNAFNNQAAQQQQQQQPMQMTPTMGNAGGMMNMNMNSLQQYMQQAQNMHQRTPSGSGMGGGGLSGMGMGGLSQDVLQSFIRRKPGMDGNNN